MITLTVLARLGVGRYSLDPPAPVQAALRLHEAVRPFPIVRPSQKSASSHLAKVDDGDVLGGLGVPGAATDAVGAGAEPSDLDVALAHLRQLLRRVVVFLSTKTGTGAASHSVAAAVARCGGPAL